MRFGVTIFCQILKLIFATRIMCSLNMPEMGVGFEFKNFEDNTMGL
jgi:hypothetical protein